MKRLILNLLIFVVFTEISAQNWVDVKGGLDGRVTDMIECKGKLVVIGDFQHAGDLYSPRMAIWDGENWEATFDTLFGPPRNLVVNNDSLFCVLSSSVYYWNGTVWSNYLLFNCFDEDSVLIYPDRVFSFMGKIYISSFSKRLYRIENNTLTLIARMTGFVHDQVEYQGQLYLTGCFDTINNERYGHVAKYDGVQFSPVDNGFTSNSGGSSISVFNGIVYIGGNLHKYYDNISSGLFRYDGNILEAVGEIGFETFCSEVDSSSLFVFQGFPNDTTLHYSYNILKWDGTEWTNMGIILEGFYNAYNYKGKMFIYGIFENINGHFYNHIAYWDEQNGIKQEELFENTITVFPNPAVDLITIKQNGNNFLYTAEVFDMNGKKLLTKNIDNNNPSINIQSFIPGFYLIGLKNEKESFVLKFVKN